MSRAARFAVAANLAAMALVAAGCEEAPKLESTPTPTSVAPMWQPAADTSWHLQLSGGVDWDVPVDAYILDADETSAVQVKRLLDRGVKPVCYFSAGSVEEWRPDQREFPDEVVGNDMDGWAGEKWLDIRRRDVLVPMMRERMAACQKKGFVGVDADNVGVLGNDTGFEASVADQTAYARALANAAHELGLAFGLKNAVESIPEVADEVQFAVNEECVALDECGAYAPLVDRGVPVLNLEYDTTDCDTVPDGFTRQLRARDLGPDVTRCG